MGHIQALKFKGKRRTKNSLLKTSMKALREVALIAKSLHSRSVWRACGVELDLLNMQKEFGSKRLKKMYTVFELVCENLQKLYLQ